jgi:23S rRNA maturation-related 3'-5' exoribonuclease YhaM
MLESPVNIRFKQQLSLISDASKRSKVEELLRQTSVRNIKEPASSTGKYHPEWAHGDYGLSRHVKAVVAFVSDICEAFPDLNRDSMIIAALMHDIVKYVGEGKYTVKDHAAQAGDMLEKVGLTDEARMVRSHMGRWDAERGKAPAPTKFDERMLHLADYFASRQYITIDFDEDDNIVKTMSDKIRVDRGDYDKAKLDQDELAMMRGEKDIPF